MYSTVPNDPNFPSDLRIVPSTSKVIQVGARVGAGAGNSSDDDAGQDIEGFGIAGRTWEAAYAMRLYLSPPAADVQYAPPCPLYAAPPSSKPSRHTLLEIGSGTGYLSLALAPHLPPSATLILTDLASVVPLLSRNLLEARSRWMTNIHPSSVSQVKVEALPWGDEEALRELSLFREAERDDEEVTILASDLVYFPFLYPPLLRTLLWLTKPRRDGGKSPKVLFAYKVRSLVREEPFWSAFEGRWFDMESVLTRSTPPASSSPAKDPPCVRFGEEDDIHIFVCTRRPSTFDLPIPSSDEHLMRGSPGDATSASDQFELMLFSGISLDSDSEDDT
ncbi:hypothetical protein P7C70_g9123, partial [Phenoliferia sp. Uapishka_3]